MSGQSSLLAPGNSAAANIQAIINKEILAANPGFQADAVTSSVEQPVYDIGRLAGGRARRGMERRVAGRVVGVEQRRRFAPVPGVVSAESLALSRGLSLN